MVKYEKFGKYLEDQKGKPFSITFGEIEEIIGEKLPDSAYKHSEWWSNSDSHVLMKEVLSKNWKSRNLDLEGKFIDFYNSIESPILQFLKYYIKMFRNYQPIVIKMLLESKNHVTNIPEIKNKFQELNFDRGNFNEPGERPLGHTAIDSVKKVFSDGKLISFPEGTSKGDVKLIDNKINESEIKECLKICGKKILQHHVDNLMKKENQCYYIRPGVNGEFWKEFRTNNFVAVDYLDQNKPESAGDFDLSGLTKDEISKRKGNTDDNTELFNISQIKKGDIIAIVNNLKTIEEFAIASEAAHEKRRGQRFQRLLKKKKKNIYWFSYASNWPPVTEPLKPLSSPFFVTATKTTLYEFSFPAASLGLDGYESGMQIGVGVCVNDGDTQDGQGGQKGWSGWGPYAAVYGKTASATGLVSLVGEAPGLVAHWPMNEGSGDVFKDAVGGFDGFLPLGQGGAQTEVSWGEGPPTQANSVEFSGANSFIATSFPGIGAGNPRTVAFWVRTTDADAYFVSWGANQTAKKWHIRANGASGVMRTEYAGGQNFATTSIIDGEWHHVASVVPNGATEGEQILHYIDGVLDPRAGGANQTIDTAIPTDAVLDWTNFGGAVAYPVHIGARMNANFTSMLDGSIADVRIYNHGLSEDQIRAIFQGKAEDGMNLEGPTIVDFGDLSGDASYEFFFKAIKAGASTAIAGNDAFALKLDQWNEQGVFGTTVFGVADNVFTPVEGKSVASVFDRDVHVVVVNDTAAGETRLYVDGDHVGVLSGNFELAGEGEVMGARIDANTDPMGEGSVMHKWATYDKALTDEQIAGLADEVAPLPDLVDISKPGDAVVASSDNHPAGEHAGLAIDDNDQTKYLNFDGANNNASGLTITTAGGVVTGLGLTSANDAPDRDPATFVLSGSNDGGATLTEIASGDVPAFGARFERQEVRFANDAAYTTYELIFPTTTGPSTCCMQIAEIELLGTPTVPIVSNGSFEADDVPEWPGYGAITAWTGGSGINDGGPFGDNGVIPDGAKLGFIQGTRALSQQLTGLEAGAEYVLAFYYNARNCCGGTIGFTVSVGGEELGSVSDVEPVGGENAYNSASYNFVAAGTEAELVFSATAAGDATLLLDAVSVSRAGEGPAEAPAPAELPWSVGLNDDGWPAGDGGGPNTTFVQEAGVNELPGNPANAEVAQQGDDDYYWAGVYSTVIAGNGDYTPVGLVEVNEESAERAFAGVDNDLRYHFNLPESLEPTDRLYVSYDALNLHGDQADSRYGIEVYVNNVQVQSEVVIRPDQLGQTYDTEPFTLADVNAEVGSGYDNILTLKGVNYNAEGGGNWMGIDYVQLSQAAEPVAPLAVSWDFDDGLPDGSEVAGNAEHSATEGVDGSGALVITRALGGQKGGWLSAEVGTVSDFIIDFDILMDGGAAPQADGISMAIADDLVPFAAFGEDGVGSGLRVNFDNWDNGDGAPSIEIEFGGERIASVPMGTQSESTLDTDGWWPVHIELSPDGDLSLLYNGELIHDAVNIAAFAPIENARIAFGGRTGGANANQFIDNFSIVAWEAAPAPAPEILIDFAGTGANSAGASPDPWISINNLVMDEAVDLGGGVTITALDDGFNPNNTASPGAGAEHDGVSVPQEARNDYLFKIADAAGTTARMRIDGLAAGTYNVTVFEGRTTDASQFAKIWTGEEPAAENTGDFAKGSATVTVTVGAGEPLWYMHLEDGSGGVSGMMIREAADTPALSIVNNGDGTVTVTFEGTLQAAASVNGPWADVDAPSPLTTPANEAMQYARAVK